MDQRTVVDTPIATKWIHHKTKFARNIRWKFLVPCPKLSVYDLQYKVQDMAT